ncbi:MAG: hypothetical protein A2017_16145 [Lentisphaerae bacterium GWF2_44_16]|nr:MAG: hypothetical protein A2017_16145 [Lentisphaerae bacterium GWF2_44_16]
MLAFFLVSGSIFSAEKDLPRDSRLIKDVEVKLKFLETPRITADNTSSSAAASKGKWLCIDVTYVLPDVTGKSSDIEWMDDLEILYEVLYPSMYKGKNIIVKFMGRTLYWSVAMDNKKHKADAYIPPQILHRYGRSDMRAGDLMKSIEIRVTFYDRNGKPLGRAYYPRNDKTAVSNFSRTDEMTSPVPKLADTIYPRNKTPWAFLEYDNYELIKAVETGKK